MKKITSLSGDFDFLLLKKLIMIMKITLLLILISAGFVFAEKTYSQTKMLNLNMGKTTVREALSKIEDQSEFYFMFSSKIIDVNREVMVDVENQKIDDVLSALFDGTNVEYTIKDRIIVLTTPEVLSEGNLAVLQQKSISGKVTDSNGQPLPGVSVVIKGTTQGTVTAASGDFFLSNIPEATTLVFSFVGMKTQEILVGDLSNLNVIMEEVSIGIDEVVAVGYGTTRKKDLTGSVGVVQVRDMVKAPVAGFSEALAGRVAGVQVATFDGQPGRTANLIIRGSNTLTQSATPLYVIDGFPVENPDINALNPEEIESISILKDASSAAIYGSRASNGVVLINTKRGKTGKPVVQINASSGFQNNYKKIEMMDPYEYVKYITELHPNREYATAYLAEGRTVDYYKNVQGVDWVDQVFQQGKVNIINLSVRGGTEQTKYSVSGSIHDQLGVIINTGFKRYNGRFTLDQDLSQKLKAGLTANYSYSGSYGLSIASIASGNISSTALFRAWAYRPIDFQESPDFATADADFEAITPSDFRINPVVDLNNQHNVSNNGLLESNAYLNYEITKGLVFKITGGIRRSNYLSEQFYNSKTIQGSPYNPLNQNGIWGNVVQSISSSWVNEYLLSYDKTFAVDHNIKAIGLFSMNSNSYYVYGYGSRLLPNESLGLRGMDEGTPFQPTAAESNSSIMSYASRLEYNYKSKYLITATFRADGSSRFPDTNKWGYFPGIAAAWNMDQEEFFNSSVVNLSKIRFSYGITGNNRIGDYTRFARLSQSIQGYPFNNKQPDGSIWMSSVANEKLKWEKTEKMDLAYELGLFDSRITLETNIYRNKTTDLLLNAPLPPTSGFSSAIKNIGSLKNEGLEFTLKTINMDIGDFKWYSDFNISFNKNTITALNEGQVNLTQTTNGDVNFSWLYLSQVGKSTGMMYGYVWEGNYQYEDFDNPAPGVYVLKPNLPTNGLERAAVQPGDIKYRDLNNDGVVNSYDRTFIGRGQPIHVGGLNNNLVYKNFSLNLFLQWSYGNNIYNANRLTFEGNSNQRIYMNQYASYIDRWTPENQTNNNYRAGGQGVIGYHSSRVVEDGSYLRLKTVSLDYRLPKNISQILYMSDLTLNISAQNMLTWTKYTGLDPEVSVSPNHVLAPGYDFSAYPNAQTIVLGIKATF